MGIYIKSMEMPKSCYACMFFAQTNYWNKEDEADILSHCKRTGEKTWESVNGYLPNCPLVPVPPHGDLIDRDALVRELTSIRASFGSANGLVEGGLNIAVSTVNGRSTIIPASEEGE